MKSAFVIIVLAASLTLAPATAWSQTPALSYTSAVGAATDISGGVYNPGIGWWLPDGGWFNPCPPTVVYGRNDGFGDPARQTGGDGFSKTADINPLNTGGRTQTSFAFADADGGYARAFADADTSTPCIVFENGAIYMSAFGLSFAQFYQTYTVGSAPAGSAVDLNWKLKGTFSSLTSGGGGFVRLSIYLLSAPPPWPTVDVPVTAGSLAMLEQDINSVTWWDNVAGCALQNCTPEPKAPVIHADGTIDLRAAYEGATGRPMAAGDSFIIGAVLVAQTRNCGSPDACALLPAFTTDFSVSTTVTANNGAVVSRQFE